MSYLHLRTVGFDEAKSSPDSSTGYARNPPPTDSPGARREAAARDPWEPVGDLRLSDGAPQETPAPHLH